MRRRPRRLLRGRAAKRRPYCRTNPTLESVKHPSVVLALALAVPAAGQWTPPPLYDSGEPTRTCESLATLDLLDATVESATIDTAGASGPPYCRVTVIATHPPVNDRVTIWVALPTENWNGRFLGTGGGGFSGGSPRSLPGAVREGFAAAATDTGHEGASGSFALGDDGALQWMLIRDNAYLGIHAMTRVGKELTAAFYGRAPGYSYFRGCSTGGRQGLMEVQRYPRRLRRRAFRRTGDQLGSAPPRPDVGSTRHARERPLRPSVRLPARPGKGRRSLRSPGRSRRRRDPRAAAVSVRSRAASRRRCRERGLRPDHRSGRRRHPEDHRRSAPA